MSVTRRLQFDGTPPAPSLEWIVTNGLGGYSSAPVGGGLTRRQHGLLVAAHPAPLGRLIALNHLRTTLRVHGEAFNLDHEDLRVLAGAGRAAVREFRLDLGLPVWTYEAGGVRIERRVVMPHRQNTVHVIFSIVGGDGGIELDLRPFFHVRPHDGGLEFPPPVSATTQVALGRAETSHAAGFPVVRWTVRGQLSECCWTSAEQSDVVYDQDRRRGYAFADSLSSPGFARVHAIAGDEVTFTASTEEWSIIDALAPADAVRAELERRTRLLHAANCAAPSDRLFAELALAADDFIIQPVARPADETRAAAVGSESRSVIAGYHWFTDWGRDTMISLEGLAIGTGRTAEAGYILRTFGAHVRDGLIPNLFPEGLREGLYHTADATLWFFHAIDRYVTATDDKETLLHLLPTLLDIVEHHVKGTRFGIRVDPEDGLLTQGAEGYQLTWMDAKVGNWVVTPRRGKAVEINALWYNALMCLAHWLRHNGRPAEAKVIGAYSARARVSFNAKFWNAAANCLFDVIDGPSGHDDACRPNQLFAISLPHPVLDRHQWLPVFRTVQAQLATPVGLRSLSPNHPDYKRTYDGDLRARDAAYHQGTVWGWLAGPYVDAWLRVAPDERAQASKWLEGFEQHLNEACVGSVSEIFDAEPPFTPRGCIAQAWSVAELRRARLLVSTRQDHKGHQDRSADADQPLPVR